MTKESEDPNEPNESNEWKFPEIESFGNFEGEVQLGKNNTDSENNQEEQDDEEESVNKVKTYQKNDALILMEQEIIKQNQALKNILTRIQEPLVFIDDHIINIFQDVIKKVAMKIIYKEIELDPLLIKKITDDLKLLIHSQNGTINIYLSEEDYKRIPMFAEEKSQSVIVDENLKAGDVIIKNKDTEIRALLDERIDLLMGKLHD